MITKTIALDVCIATIILAMLGACSSGPPSVPTDARSAGSRQLQQAPNNSGYQVLFEFPSLGSSCPAGAVPEGSLIVVNGTLFGTTAVGGGYGAGTLFALSLNGTEQVRFSFNNGPGSPVNPGVGVAAVNGTLYGSTSQGGAYDSGTIFGIGIWSRNAGVIHSFGGSPADGKAPAAAIIAAHGVLYGTTAAGGTQGDGTVFSIDLQTGKERVLYSFGARASDGKAPYAALLLLNGKLYGTTTAGGISGVGTVFSVDPNTGRERVLYSFSNYFDGQDPVAPLISVNGMLYGTTLQGGAYTSGSGGTVYRIDASGKNESIIHSFGSGDDGARPYSPVVALGGVLYGTTSAGGANGGNGTIYSINLTSGKEQVLHSFGVGSDGAFPVAGLLKLSGKLYGVTALGGIIGSCLMSEETGSGTVFVLKP